VCWPALHVLEDELQITAHKLSTNSYHYIKRWSLEPIEMYDRNNQQMKEVSDGTIIEEMWEAKYSGYNISGHKIDVKIKLQSYSKMNEIR
jgi:hypothetical protein